MVVPELTKLDMDHFMTSRDGEMFISDRAPSETLSHATGITDATPTSSQITNVLYDPTLGQGNAKKTAPKRLHTLLTSPGASVSPDSPPNESAVSKPATTTATTSVRKSRTKKATTTPRVSKKAREQAEFERLQTYAQDLFVELNGSIFKGGLPNDTALIWNKRLQTTAGRARWHRSREGVETCSIELSTKVLDRDGVPKPFSSSVSPFCLRLCRANPEHAFT